MGLACRFVGNWDGERKFAVAWWAQKLRKRREAAHEE